MHLDSVVCPNDINVGTSIYLLHERNYLISAIWNDLTLAIVIDGSHCHFSSLYLDFLDSGDSEVIYVTHTWAANYALILPIREAV